MKKILLILTLVLLTSCGMTNQEIIDNTKLCRDNGMGTYKTIFGNVRCSLYRDSSRNIGDEEQLSEVHKIQIQNCIDNGKQPRRSSWDSEYICEDIKKD